MKEIKVNRMIIVGIVTLVMGIGCKTWDQLQNAVSRGTCEFDIDNSDNFECPVAYLTKTFVTILTALSMIYAHIFHNWFQSPNARSFFWLFMSAKILGLIILLLESVDYFITNFP